MLALQKRFSTLCLFAGLACLAPGQLLAEPVLLAEFKSNPSTARLVDWSYCGYRGGNRTIPDVPGPVFNVTSYGAVANDGKDDIDAIQAAIDDAASKGGGVVSFPVGTFNFDVGTTRRQLRIRSSNIVLRGAGSGTTGTVFYDASPTYSTDPNKVYLANIWPSFVHASKTEIPRQHRASCTSFSR